MAETNKADVMQWLATGLLSVLMALGGYMMSRQANQVDAINNAQAAMQLELKLQLAGVAKDLEQLSNASDVDEQQSSSLVKHWRLHRSHTNEINRIIGRLNSIISGATMITPLDIYSWPSIE